MRFRNIAIPVGLAIIIVIGNYGFENDHLKTGLILLSITLTFCILYFVNLPSRIAEDTAHEPRELESLQQLQALLQKKGAAVCSELSQLNGQADAQYSR